MKFASLALASALLVAAIAPTAHAQTASQYQHQLNRAICLNNWTEALSFVRLLIGSEQTTPQQRQQLIALRDQLENHRSSNAVFDRDGDGGCAVAIASAPREAAALQAPSQPVRRPVQSASAARPATSAAVPQPAASPSVQVDPSANALASALCQARRIGLNEEAAILHGAEAFQSNLINRYGVRAAVQYMEANRDRLTQEAVVATLAQCPEVL